MIEIKEAYDNLDAVRVLFRDYVHELGVDLNFQDFDRELSTLPGKYARPKGRLYLAYDQGEAIACIALRPFEDNVGEVKRLYVKPSHRRRGISKILAEYIIEEARMINYQRLVLDTLNTMTPAMNLYRSLGFVETEAYYPNPLEGATYFALEL
jgi:GNAT superfamily N-acetyltransferase